MQSLDYQPIALKRAEFDSRVATLLHLQASGQGPITRARANRLPRAHHPYRRITPTPVPAPAPAPVPETPPRATAPLKCPDAPQRPTHRDIDTITTSPTSPSQPLPASKINIVVKTWDYSREKGIQGPWSMSFPTPGTFLSGWNAKERPVPTAAQ
jgi:hypothetical protein